MNELRDMYEVYTYIYNREVRKFGQREREREKTMHLMNELRDMYEVYTYIQNREVRKIGQRERERERENNTSMH